MPSLTTKPCIAIVAGGTGGHVMPALSVALELKELGYRVIWFGTDRGLEQRQCELHDIKFYQVAIEGFRSKGLRQKFMVLGHLAKAIVSTWKILRQEQVGLVLGLGGYVSVPVGIAAFLSFKALVIHEQNRIPGLANRLLKLFARQVCAGFPDAFPVNAKITYTGNPVRKEFLNLPKPQQRFVDREDPIRILVLGGSLGAFKLNAVVPEAMQLLQDRLALKVQHQTGKDKLAATKKKYQQSSFDDVILADFIDDMAQALAWADIVICRAGALTIAELAAVGVAGILIPYPFAVDDHQTANANSFAQLNGARVLPESELDAAKLAEEIYQIAQDRDLLQQMAEINYQYAERDATAKVIGQCLQVLDA